VWSYVSDSYAGGSVATGRACHARQIKGDDIDQKGFHVSPFWGLGKGLTSHKNMHCCEASKIVKRTQHYKALTIVCNSLSQAPILDLVHHLKFLRHLKF
jgi:hypothetical protein